MEPVTHIRTEHDFGFALEWLRAKSRVRRRSWPPGSFMTLQCGMFYMHEDTGMDGCVSVLASDILARDWELVHG
jgi:hypothetical protein